MCATGNNLRPQGDMVRRCYLIRLDAKMVHPHKRTGFKHEQPAWARKHRAELATALLTLIRAWVVAGRPEPDVPAMGGFDRWVYVVGGILQNAGVEGFLGKLDELEETAFSENDRWARLLAAIQEWAIDRNPESHPRFTAGNLAESIEANYTGGNLDRDPVVMRIIDALPAAILKKLRCHERISHSLGKAFQFRMERMYPGGWHLQRREKSRNGVIWEVQRDDETIDSNATRSEDPQPSSHRHGSTEEAPF